MRKLIVSEFVTLDGVIQPTWRNTTIIRLDFVRRGEGR
jgi:hypothetical protein